MESLDAHAKGNFMPRRFMDDILLLFRVQGWDAEGFYADFTRSECSMPPLKLEEATAGTFLETTFGSRTVVRGIGSRM